MWKILIDATERKNKKVCLIKIDNNVEQVVAEKYGDVDVVTTTDTLAKENNLKLKDIENFDYVDGNGSFTGIKNAAAVANILQWAVNDIPIEDLHLPSYGGEPNIQINSKP